MEKQKRSRRKKVPASGDVIQMKLRENLDGVLEGFVQAAKEGSCPHFKLICELLQNSDGEAKPDPARALLAAWRREQRMSKRARGSDGRFVARDDGAAIARDEQKNSEEQ